MNFLFYVTVFAIASVVTAQYVEYRPADLQTQSTSTALQIPQYITRGKNPTLIAYTLELPKAEAPTIPFYSPELIGDLQPPSIQSQNVPIYYEYPEPSVELQVPREGSWNPNNDPNLYYDTVPVLVDLEAPTNLHPKKFNKDLHEKKYSGEPKKEVILKPVTDDELAQQQKTFEKLAKLENQKEIRNEKTEQAVQI